MKHIKMNKICLFLLVCSSQIMAQTPGERAFERTTKTLTGANLGIAKAAFAANKPGLPKPKANPKNIEIVENIAQDGLEKAIYHFGVTGKQPLYEVTLEFSDDTLRQEVSEKMFGPPNNPAHPNRWILGVQGRVVSIGWSDGKKFAFAANLPGTALATSDLFKIPADFEMHKNLPPPSEWPAIEVTRFFDELQLQIDAGATGFASVKGGPIDNYFECLEPLSTASLSAIMVNPDKTLFINNEMTSEMSLENATKWKDDLAKILDAPSPNRCKLGRNNLPKTLFGKKAAVWDVLDKDSKPTGVRIGLVAAGELLHGVFVVVMKG